MRRNLAEMGVGFAVATLAATALVVIGFIAGRGVTALHRQPTPTFAFPTLTPAPTSTPITFPDALAQVETAVPTAAVPAIAKSLPSALQPATNTPQPDVMPPQPTLTSATQGTATPVPPTATSYVARDYWERRADGNYYNVDQWSDGRFTTIGEMTATPALPPTATPHPWYSPVVPTPTPGYRLGTLVWSYSTPGYVPGDLVRIPFAMRKGDHLEGALRVSGGPVQYWLSTTDPWATQTYVNDITFPTLIAWQAPADANYALTIFHQSVEVHPLVHVDLGVYRP